MLLSGNIFPLLQKTNVLILLTSDRISAKRFCFIDTSRNSCIPNTKKGTSYLRDSLDKQRKKHRKLYFKSFRRPCQVVEVTGFEPATSASRTQRSTKLSHTSLFRCLFLLCRSTQDILYYRVSELSTGFLKKIKKIFCWDISDCIVCFVCAIRIIYPRPRGEAPRGGDIISSAVGSPEIALYWGEIFPFRRNHRIAANGYPNLYLLRNPSFFHLKYHIRHIHSGFSV